MIEIKDENSESWAELTQPYYADNDAEADVTVRVRVDVNVTVSAEVEQKRPGFTRRYGASTSEFESEYPSLTESSTVRQRERDFDVRSRLNRNGRGDYHGRMRGGYRDNAPWKRDQSRESYEDDDSYSYSHRNAHRSDDKSPFRSPLNHTKRSGFRDMDNGSNFRFNNHRRGGSGSNRGYNNERYVPQEITKGSCRKLYSSSQDDDYEGETKERFKVVTDEDRVKLARREKDIAYGKNTDDYKKYVQIVPRRRRKGDRKLHPRTPDKFVNCSRRSWDAQVKRWKLNLHAWAANYETALTGGDCSQKSSLSEGTASTTESTSVKEEDMNSALTEDSFDLSDDEHSVIDKEQEEKLDVEVVVKNIKQEEEEEAEESKEEDDFLDSLDYSSLVGKQENV